LKGISAGVADQGRPVSLAKIIAIVSTAEWLDELASRMETLIPCPTGRALHAGFGRSGPATKRSETQKSILKTVTDARLKDRKAYAHLIGKCYQCGSSGHKMGSPDCSKRESVNPAVKEYDWVCASCGVVKHKSDFGKRQGRKHLDNDSARCRSCARSRSNSKESGEVGQAATEPRRCEAVSEEPYSRPVLIDNHRTSMTEDNGSDFSTIRKDMTEGLTVHGAEDPDLAMVLSRGVTGMGGDSLSPPIGVVDLEFIDLLSELALASKFFVYDSDKIPPIVAGRNILDEVREGSADGRAAADVRRAAKAVADRQDGPFRSALGGLADAKTVPVDTVAAAPAPHVGPLSKGDALRAKLAPLLADKLERAGSIEGEEFAIRFAPESMGAVPPASAPVRTHSWEEAKAIKEFLQDGLRTKLLRRSVSPGNNRLVVVNQNGKWRVCLDLTRVNRITADEVQLIPVIDEVLERLRQEKPSLASVLDLTKGYWQLPLSEESRAYTAFSVGGEHYEFSGGSPFGLKGLPTFFNQLVKRLLVEEGLSSFCANIMDDIIVWGDEETHDERVERVVSRLAARGVVFSQSKAQLRLSKLVFSGKLVELTENGPVTRPGPKFTEKLKEIAIPVSRDEWKSVSSFLAGLMQHCPGLAERTAFFKAKIWGQPSGQRIVWPEADVVEWRLLLDELLASQAIRVREVGAQCFVFTDASSSAEMVLVYQGSMVTKKVGKETVVDWEASNLYLVDCKSRAFAAGSEQNWGIWKKETHAVFWAVCEAFPELLRSAAVDGSRHMVVTDSTVANGLMSSDPKEAIIRSWQSRLSESAVDIFWTSGPRNPSDFGTRRLLGFGDMSDLRNALLRDDSVARVRGPLRAAKASLGKVKLSGPLSAAALEVLDSARTAHSVNHEGKDGALQRWKDSHEGPVSAEQLKAVEEALVAIRASCGHCQRFNSGGNLAPTLRIVDPGVAPFERIAADLKVFNSTDSHGFRYICVAIDYHTKYTVVVPLRSKKIKSIEQALKDRVAAYFGSSEVFVADNGSEFNQGVLLASWGADRFATLPGEPQGNGQVERVMSEIGKWFSTLSESQKREWSVHLWEFQLKFNTALFRATGSSRALALMGFQPKLPLSFGARQPEVSQGPRGSAVLDQRRPLVEKYRKNQKVVERAFNKATGASNVSVSPGDLVLVEVPADKAVRYGEKFSGPVEVVAVDNDRRRVSVSTVGGDGRNPVMKHMRRVKFFIPPVSGESEAAALESSSKRLSFGESRSPKLEQDSEIDSSAAPLAAPSALFRDRLIEAKGRKSSRSVKGDLLGLDHDQAMFAKTIGGHQFAEDGKLQFFVSNWTTGHLKNTGEWVDACFDSKVPSDALIDYLADVDDSDLAPPVVQDGAADVADVLDSSDDTLVELDEV
jgi:hypothetical protein